MTAEPQELPVTVGLVHAAPYAYNELCVCPAPRACTALGGCKRPHKVTKGRQATRDLHACATCDTPNYCQTVGYCTQKRDRDLRRAK